MFYKYKKISLLFIFIFILPTYAIGANWCIRAGATGSGNGTDWTNAFPTWPSTFVRGDTYYIADGVYPVKKTFNTALSGTTYIYIKKATVAAHGTATGWLNSYGDGQATFCAPTGTSSQTSGSSVFAISTGYWDFDGITGSGMTGSSYGFVFDLSDTSGFGSAAQAFRCWSTSYSPSHLTFKHSFFTQATNLPATSVDWSFFYMWQSDYLSISNCYFYHGVAPILLRYCDDFTLENCIFDSSMGNASNHGESVSGHGGGGGTSTASWQYRWIIRNNIFKDVYGSAIITFNGDQLDYYGNLVYGTTSNAWTSNGVVASMSDGMMTNLRFHNNSMVNLGGNAGLDTTYTGTATAQNNIWFNCSAVNSTGNRATHSYNWFGSVASNALTGEATGLYNQANPFVNSANYNFMLKDPIGGAQLSALYSTDMNGVTRGADGGWDRGAFEYNGQTLLSNPTGLKVISP